MRPGYTAYQVRDFTENELPALLYVLNSNDLHLIDGSEYTSSCCVLAVNLEFGVYEFMVRGWARDNIAKFNVRAIQDVLVDPLWKYDDNIRVGMRVRGEAEDAYGVKGILIGKVLDPEYPFIVKSDEFGEQVFCRNVELIPHKRRMTWEELEKELGYEIELT